jgi:hypothetical protein
VAVFDEVDLETALETIAVTGYYNAGPDCTAPPACWRGPGTTTTNFGLVITEVKHVKVVGPERLVGDPSIGRANVKLSPLSGVRMSQGQRGSLRHPSIGRPGADEDRDRRAFAPAPLR